MRFSTIAAAAGRSITALRSSNLKDLPEMLALSHLARRLESVDPAEAVETLERALAGNPKSQAIAQRYVTALMAAGDAEFVFRQLCQTAARLGGCEPLYDPIAAGMRSCGLPADEISALVQPVLAAEAEYSERFRPICAQFAQLGDLATATRLARRVLGRACAGVCVSTEDFGKQTVLIRLTHGGYHVTFSSGFLPWGWLFDRVFGFRSYLEKLAGSGSVGGFKLCLGDFPEGDAPQLCFSGREPRHHLVPDPMFLGSGGYASWRHEFDASSSSFDARRRAVYWRGSLTGLADRYREIMQLPRIELCLLSKHAYPFVDAKLTDLSQFGPLLPTLQFMLEGLDLCGPREPESNNLFYRYLVDVDGNTNSWSGFWLKLYSGSAVFKLRSPWRQWFYDQLGDRQNVLLFDQLSPGLEEAFCWCEANPFDAARIGAAGRALAESLTPESQYPVFAAAVDRVAG